MKLSEIIAALESAGIGFKVEQQTEEEIQGFSSLFQYKEGTMTFIVPERKFEDFKDQFESKHISFMIIGQSEAMYDCFGTVIRVSDPRKAFFTAIERCFDSGNDETVTGISSDPAIYSKRSWISPSAKIGKNVKIGIGCVIEGNVVIGDDTEIHHNVVIRNKTKIGSRCTIHSGVIIGEYGFGYTVNELEQKTMLKHYGGVTIQDDVHIGDNSIIIRGAIDDTVISKGVKLNTLVHIAHNDFVGENTIVTSPIHICGSVTIGKNCHIAGATIRNQRSVGDGATVGLGAVVVKDVPERTVVVGNPAKKLEK